MPRTEPILVKEIDLESDSEEKSGKLSNQDGEITEMVDSGDITQPQRDDKSIADKKPTPNKSNPFRLLKNYFKETTVHGIKYIVTGDNILDRLFWVCAVIVAFFITFEINRAYILEASKNPLTISLSAIPVSDVPFPAVTVSTGKVWNPMGYVRKALSGL